MICAFVPGLETIWPDLPLCKLFLNGLRFMIKTAPVSTLLEEGEIHQDIAKTGAKMVVAGVCYR